MRLIEKVMTSLLFLASAVAFAATCFGWEPPQRLMWPLILGTLSCALANRLIIFSSDWFPAQYERERDRISKIVR